MSTNGYRKYTNIWWMLVGLSTWLIQPIVATTSSPDSDTFDQTCLAPEIFTVKWTEPSGNQTSVVLTCNRHDGSSSDPVTKGDVTATCRHTGTSGVQYSLTLYKYINDGPPACSSPGPDVTGGYATTIGRVHQYTTSIIFKITPGQGHCSKYKISYGIKGAQLIERPPEMCTPGSPTRVLLNNLAANAEYTIEVLTITTATGKEPNPKERKPATTDGWTAPEAAPKPTTLDQGSRWVQMQVEEVVARPENIAEYQLIVEGDGVSQCYKVAKIGTPSTDCLCVDSGPLDTNPVNVTGLTPYKNYTFSVRAVNPGACSVESEQQVVLTDQDNPFPAKITNVVAVSSFAINVTWILDPEAYPTGEFVNYNATATAPGGSKPYSYSVVKGFNTSSALILNLEPYVNYSVVVIALTTTPQGVQLETRSDPRDVRTLEFYPEAVDTFEVQNGEPDSCHTFSFDWSAPSTPNGEITGYIIKYQQMADPSDNGTKKFDSQSNSGSIECLNSNDVAYTFTIQAENNIGFGNESMKEGVRSGICHPTSASDNAIGNIHVGKSQTSVTVEVKKCDICYNSNGDVTFAGLLVIEKTGPVPEKRSYDNKAALDADYGPWDNKGPGPGYRTTPDTWPDEVNCSGVISQCRGEQPGCTTARKSRAAAGTFEYTIGQPPPGGCQPDTYCNQKLSEGKQYMLRLVVGTAGGMLMGNSTDTFEIDKDMTRLIGAVVPVVLIVTIIIVTVVIMYKRAIGPFSLKTKRTKEPETISIGSTVHVYADMDDTSITRPEPVTLARFHQHVLDHQTASDWLFVSEYKVLRTLSPMYSRDAAEHTDNRMKNIGTIILPFDHSRVKLKGNNYENCSDYINASYIPGYNSTRGFIACQSPMMNTVVDFWCMIWDQNVSTVVMLAQLEESGREIYAQYWPKENTSECHGELRVETISEVPFNKYILRDLAVRKGLENRTIKQFQYVLWPDLSVPNDLDTFVNLVADVRSHILSDIDIDRAPVVVHCSAGVGRTGTYIAVDRLLQHIKENNTIDVFGIVMEMRNYRCYMVQTEAQYIMVHKCVQRALERGLHKPLEATGAISMVYANLHHGDKHLY